MENRETELAWAAGFFDGEGSSFLGSKDYMQVGIGQIHPEVLERFKAAVGLGTINGPYPHATNPHWSPRYEYSASSEDAIKVMNLLYRFLGSVKRAQYEGALENVKRKLNADGYCRAGHDQSLPNAKTNDREKCRVCHNATQNRIQKEKRAARRVASGRLPL